MNNIIEVKNIFKTFTQAQEKFEVIRNASIELKSSDFAALVGPSGSGKTTLLQICGLLDNPTSGSIFIDGIDVSNSDDAVRTSVRKQKIGFIYQFHHLMPEFNAIENVALPLLIQGVNKDEAFKKASQTLDEVELGNRLNFKPSQLSGGQQQRVAIARAIVSKPKLVLADEPTGNLDSDLSEKIFDILKNLVKKYQIACLVVTHNLELAKKTDKTLLIKNGEIFDTELNSKNR